MFKRLIASIVCLTFIFSNVQYTHAQDFSVNQLPVPGTMVGESDPFAPLALKGVVVNPQKPLEFQFIVDTGRGPQDTASVKERSNQLVKYFLAGLTIPEGDLWVNLSPYEKDRIVPQALGQTDLGRDLLAQDYILKQLTASLIYPEKDLGKEFWSKVYAKAQEQFGTTNIPINTFNKVWILPNEAQVYENGNAAYVTKSTLKVMLDEDYLALQKHLTVLNGTDSIGSNIVRQIILPEIEKEVNTGKNFALIRQIYQALILAKWYKETIQNGLLDALYTNKGKVSGVNLKDPTVKQQIYARYIQAYKKGVFNYIKVDALSNGQTLARKYFSGGTIMQINRLDRSGSEGDVHGDGGATLALTVDLENNSNGLTNRAMIIAEMESQINKADDLNSSGNLWDAYKRYRRIIASLELDKRNGDFVDEELAAVRVKALAIMHNMLKDAQLKEFISQRKFALYSGPPAGGKGDVWKQFTSRYGDISDSFKLFHTRGIRSGESQGNPWHFRIEQHLLDLQEKGEILTTLVNNQLQGLALDAIDDTWELNGEKGSTQVEGLTNIFNGDKVRVLEGGFGWFLTLMAQGGYSEIATIFISPFTEEKIQGFENQGARYKAMFEKAQELYTQELEEGKLMPQEEFARLTKKAGDEAAGKAFSVQELVINGFKKGADKQDWPEFEIKAANSEDLKTQGLHIIVPADGLFYAAAYETAKRLHGRQWKAVKENKGDFNGRTPKELGFADVKNYLDRSYEAAVQVHTRGLYGVTLINGFQEDDNALKEQMSRLTDEFAYTIFDALLQDIASAKAREEFLASPQAARLLPYYSNNVKILDTQLSYWQQEYRLKLKKELDFNTVEFFDIVDENGIPTGRIKPRDLVHHDGDLHRDVRIILVNSRGEVPIQLRSPTKDIEPGLYGESSGGHLGLGESYDQGLRREISEELGIPHLDTSRLKLLWSNNRDRVTGVDLQTGVKSDNDAFYNMYRYQLSPEEEANIKVNHADGIAGFIYEKPEVLRAQVLANPHTYAKSLREVFLDEHTYRQITDSAMRNTGLVDKNLGGIDLNKINLHRTGRMITVQFDPAQLNEMAQGGFKGFTPVIINVSHIQNMFQVNVNQTSSV